MQHEPKSGARRMSRAVALGVLGALVAGGGLVACDEEPPEAPVADEADERERSEAEPTAEAETAGGAPDACLASAQAATKALKVGLKTRLMEAMREGGPAAVRVCADEAEAIRARVAEETGVRVGRTSTKLRNPANAEAPEWAKAYLAAPSREGDSYAPWSERTPSEARVASPLVAEGLCLTCHGESIPPEIASVIDEHFPEDEARGFAAGDLRGVAWAVARCER